MSIHVTIVLVVLQLGARKMPYEWMIMYEFDFRIPNGRISIMSYIGHEMKSAKVREWSRWNLFSAK